jgi:hypothetical protein
MSAEKIRHAHMGTGPRQRLTGRVIEYAAMPGLPA